MRYPGGKNGSGVAQWIISLMPEHLNFGELFVGSAAVYRAKPEIEGRSVLVDSDPDAPAMTMEDPNAEIVLSCAIRWLEENAHLLTSDWLLYIDPPYPMETRVKKKIYKNELSKAQHARLLALIGQLNCRVMISSYFSKQYSTALAGWKIDTKTVTTRGGLRTEYVWSNFELVTAEPEPAKLARATPLLTLEGVAGFRERERVKRKVKRWGAKFAKLSAVEKRLIWQVIAAQLSVAEQTPPVRPKTSTDD